MSETTTLKYINNHRDDWSVYRERRNLVCVLFLEWQMNRQ